MPSPLIVATFQATILACISNIAAQFLAAYRADIPLIFNIPDLLRFAILTILTSPPNYWWQAWLERTFPGRAASTATGLASAASVRGPSAHRYNSSASTIFSRHQSRSGDDFELDALEKGDAQHEDDDGVLAQLPEQRKSRLDWRNTALKWVVDCITVGALLNTVVFLALTGLLKGRTFFQIGEAVKTDTIPIIVESYKIWPVASVINFVFVPVEKRIVFLSAVGLGWGVYMSLVAARQ